VIFKNTSRFYCRNSAGKYQLDVQEIKNAFLATDSQADRIRRFLQDRIAKIMADETPIELSMPHRLVLHILPINSFLNQKRLDFSVDYNLNLNFGPMGAMGWNNRYNLDGYLTYQDSGGRMPCYSYCQIFFDGTIEAVYANILKTNAGQNSQNGGASSIAGITYEQRVVKAIESYFKGYKSLGVEAPVVISLALLGCKGAYMRTAHIDMIMELDDNKPIDRDVAILPNVQTDSFDKEVPTIMKPIFDAVGNAFGHPGSYNYTQDGIWNVRNF